MTVWMAAIGGALVLLRVAWIGLIANGMASQLLSSNPLVAFGIMAATGVVFVLLVWVCVPPSSRAVQADFNVPQSDRRAVVLGGVAAGVLLAAWSVRAIHYYERVKTRVDERYQKVFRRNKPRRAEISDLSHAKLPPGFYQNTRTHRIHYVPANGIVRNAGPRLKAENLVAYTPDFSSDRRLYHAFPADEHYSTAVLIITERGGLVPSPYGSLLEGIAETAIRLVGEGRPDQAVAMLLDVSAVRLSQGKAQISAGALKQLDLAAGLAIRYALTARMDEIARLLRHVASRAPSAHNHQLINARLSQWTGLTGEKWRRTRWRKPYPLHWNGQSHKI